MAIGTLVVHADEDARRAFARGLDSDALIDVVAVGPDLPSTGVRPGTVAILGPSSSDAEQARRCLALIGRGCRVIAICTAPSPGALVKLLGAGCHGLVHPQVPSAVLRWAVRCVANGRKFVGSHVSNEVVGLALDNQRVAGAFGLSVAERKVLRYFASGLTYRQIADELALAHETVRTHARAVVRKLGASGRADAARIASDYGLI